MNERPQTHPNPAATAQPPMFSYSLNIPKQHNTVVDMFGRTWTWFEIGGLAVFLAAFQCGVLFAEAQPNIVLIVSDDQPRYLATHLLPTLGATAGWTTFSHAFTTTPLCCPSRASILTGQYAHHHGVVVNTDPLGFPEFQDARTLGTWLSSVGYKTAFLGKYLNLPLLDGPYIPAGWDTFRAFLGQADYYDYTLTNFVDGVYAGTEYYGFSPSDYSTDVLRDEALKFIRSCESADDRPFFLQVAINAPHSPFVPAPRHADAFLGIQPHRPPSFNERDIRDKPEWLRILPLLCPAQIEEMDTKVRLQLETLLAVDEMVESFMDELSANGELSNTVVIYMSDEGLLWGEHRLLAKATPYEECLRIPLQIYDGRHPRTASLDQLVLNIDIAPTILELAQVLIPSQMDGLSFARHLAGDASQLRTDFLFESPDTHFIGIHTRDWVYITNGMKELYNVQQDPYQLNNIAPLPIHAERLARFQRQLEYYFQDHD